MPAPRNIPMNPLPRAALRAFFAAGALGLALLFSQNLSAQCAMCRTALSSAEGQRWAQGINAGILLLLAAPFLIVAGALAVIYRPQLSAALSQVRERWPRLTRALSILRPTD